MKINASYLAPVLNSESIDIYLDRKSILEAMKEHLNDFKGTLLDVGCGDMPYKSLLTTPPSRVIRYIGLDLSISLYRTYNNIVPDLTWDGEKIPLPDESVECALATEVFEHCPLPEIVMKEICRVLKPQGVLFFTVPFLWPLHDDPTDQYRYTPSSLERHLLKSGFERIEIKARGGWDASLAQMIGLWVNNRSMSFWKKRLLQLLSKLIIRRLEKMDSIPEKYHGVMITGLSGIARKPLHELT